MIDLNVLAQFVTAVALAAGILGTVTALCGIWQTRRPAPAEPPKDESWIVFFPASDATALNTFTPYLNEAGVSLLMHLPSDECDALARWWERVQARQNQEALEMALRAGAPAVHAAANQAAQAAIVAAHDLAWSAPTLAEEDALASWERKRRAQQIFDTLAYPRETVQPLLQVCDCCGKTPIIGAVYCRECDWYGCCAGAACKVPQYAPPVTWTTDPIKDNPYA